MWIEALCSINSGQADKGDFLDLCEDDAKALIKSGAAREAPTKDGKPTKQLVSPREEKERIVKERKEARKAAVGSGKKDNKKAKKEK